MVDTYPIHVYIPQTIFLFSKVREAHIFKKMGCIHQRGAIIDEEVMDFEFMVTLEL